jgi:large subunit ribosomal protein L35
MNISYNGKQIVNGEYITPNNSQIQPKIYYTPQNNKKLYTVIMHDPDAPAGNHLHWVIINIPGNNTNSGNTLLDYKGPAPPKGSGTHRYIFILLEQGEKIEPITLERVTQMTDLYKKLNAKMREVSSIYFTSKNQEGGKRRKQTKKPKNPSLKKGTKKRAPTRKNNN